MVTDDATLENILFEGGVLQAATISIGAKDTRLFREAAAVPTPLADAFARQFATATAQGRAGDDWTAGYLALVREQARQGPKENA